MDIITSIAKFNGDLRKMDMNLVTFERLHFFAIAQDGKHVKATANVKREDGEYLWE